MRFHITTFGADDEREPIEVIGDVIELPNSLGEQFAVHANTLNDRDENFRVTHVGSGFRVAGGESIDGAIKAARQVMEKKSESEIRAAVDRATRTDKDDLCPICGGETPCRCNEPEGI